MILYYIILYYIILYYILFYRNRQDAWPPAFASPHFELSLVACQKPLRVFARSWNG